MFPQQKGKRGQQRNTADQWGRDKAKFKGVECRGVAQNACCREGPKGNVWRLQERGTSNRLNNQEHRGGRGELRWRGDVSSTRNRKKAGVNGSKFGMRV